LDLAWRPLTGSGWFECLGRCLPPSWMLPVVSDDEFESRLSGLADLLTGLMLPAGELPPETTSLITSGPRSGGWSTTRRIPPPSSQQGAINRRPPRFAWLRRSPDCPISRSSRCMVLIDAR